ncbi:MAG: 50S ribosomal protein L18 [Patescibacteria group bacterium]|nr:50S ribosomal protein L18 [Patescibacteria group bacterium]MDD5490207.1 50S ribosomal protein L18 [Patescibacteria group bacterium]
MIGKQKRKKAGRQLRRNRIRSIVIGTADRPRLSVFRSLKHFYLQLIDDNAGKTLASVSDKEIKAKGKKPMEIALELGKLLAKKALAAGIKEAVFDRGGYKYHGRVKAVADGAREGGLKF